MAISTTIRRHNSINTTTLQAPHDQNTRTLSSSSSSSLLNLKLLSLTSPLSSYTSLRDMLPSTTTAAINSPTASSSGYEISIRNHLVKQAAWAYLQPMSASSPTNSSSSGPHLLRRLCHRVTAFVSFINHHILPALSRIFHRILHALRGQGQQLSP